MVPEADGNLRAVPTGTEMRKAAVNDIVTMMDVLAVREHAHVMLDILPVGVLSRLTDRYVQALRDRVPSRMRHPTIGELKLLDRELFEAIFGVLTRTPDASLEAGLVWYLDRPENKLWQLMATQLDTHPDQSIEKISGEETTAKKRRWWDIESGAELREPAPTGATEGRCFNLRQIAQGS